MSDQHKMTEPAGGRTLKDLVQNDKTFWMVACEWTEFSREPSIVSAQTPNAQGRVLSRRMTSNEVCNVHPLVYAASQRQERYGFTVLGWGEIEKELYDWVMSHQPQAPPDGEPGAPEEPKSSLLA